MNKLDDEFQTAENSPQKKKNLLSSSARMGRRFSKLKALAALDSPLFFLLLAAAAAAELTAEKSTTDCPPAGSVQVSVASDPPCCLAARYSP